MAHVHAPGLVLRMDPDELLKYHATCSCSDDEAVNAQHYFVCIEADAKQGLWVPLLSGPRYGTKEFTTASKTGDPRWVSSSSHYGLDQVWRATHKAAQMAAAAAHDRSSAKLPNRVSVNALPSADTFTSLPPPLNGR